MSAVADGRVTVLRVGGGDEAPAAFAALQALALPRAQAVLATDHKVDGSGLVTVLNVEGDYPAATLDLRNAALLGAGERSADYLAAGFEAYCLERALHRMPDRSVLLWRSGDAGVLDRIRTLRPAGAVTILGEGPAADILADGADPAAGRLVGLVTALYRSGGALSSTDYALPVIVQAALASARVR